MLANEPSIFEYFDVVIFAVISMQMSNEIQWSSATNGYGWKSVGSHEIQEDRKR